MTDGSIGRLGKAWIAGVLAYAILRALIAWPTLGRYGVDPFVFLAIDLGTAYPYALGQVKIVSGFRWKNYRQVQTWIGIVAITFLAPYLYVFAAGGQELPTEVWVILSILILALGLSSVLRMRTQYRRAETASEPAAL